MFPIIAAWLEPKPGRKLQRGDAIIEAISGFFIFWKFISGFVIICFGIFILFFIESVIVDAPKSPVSKGRRGWFRFSKFKTK